MRFGGLFRERALHQSRVAILGYRGLRAAAAKLGFDVLLRTFYSPVPHLDELPPHTFDRVSELPGLNWDLDAQVRLLEDRLAQHMGDSPRRYMHLGGRTHMRSTTPPTPLFDATVGYSMVCWVRPGQVVELGSGHSTLVTAEAGLRNEAEGARSSSTSTTPSRASSAMTCQV